MRLAEHERRPCHCYVAPLDWCWRCDGEDEPEPETETEPVEPVPFDGELPPPPVAKVRRRALRSGA